MEMSKDTLEWFRRYFRPHFDEWIFGPINRLVHSQDALSGFILMTCAIDYLSGFWWGENTEGKNKKVYIGFIDEYFPPRRYDSNALYDSLRNGLVHMFTIKGMKYTLIHNHPALHLSLDQSGQIILNAADFRDDLVSAKQRYFAEVEVNPKLMDKLLKRYQRDGFMDIGELQIQKNAG
jgi:hypothetical protein